MIGLRRRREASHQPGRAFLVSVGIAAVAFAIALLYVGYNAPNDIPFRSYYTIHAQFRNADNLEKHAEVRMDGDLVGQVLNPRASNDLALADLQLSPSVRPLMSSTRLVVRPRSLIGVRYVEIIPGSQGRPIPPGGAIPASHTSATVPLDKVLDALDPATRGAARNTIDALGIGVADRGQELSQTLQVAPATLTSLATTLGSVSAHPMSLRDLVDAGAGAAQAAAPVAQQDIAGGFRPEAEALRPLITARRQVGATLDQAVPTLAVMPVQLAPTSRLAVALTRFTAVATPVLQAAPPALSQTASLLREAQPGVRAADQTLGLLRRAIPPTLGLLNTVTPALPFVDEMMSDTTGILQTLGPRACDLTPFRNWADIMQNGDATGHILRLDLIATPSSLAGQGGSAPVTPAPLQNAYPAPCQAARDR
jgi:ABC-type transporter Mla subunit MlaD